MKGYIDLHTHTTNSDGSYTPQELIDKARAAGIEVLAITDHNKLLKNLDELQNQNPDIRIISGSEITATHQFVSGKKAEIHIVGLLLDESPQLTEFIESNRSDGRKKVAAIIKKLKENCNIDVGTIEEIQEMFPDKRVGRMQLAKTMVAKGIVQSVTDAFDIYIGDYGQRLAWVESPNQFAGISEVVKAIRGANGIPVLAHLFSYKLSEEESQELLTVFKNAGGEAMEVEYSRYDSETREELAMIAKKWDLLPSCASDFHGHFENETLKHHFPMRYFETIENRKNELMFKK